METRPKLLQVIPAPKGSFFINGLDIFPVGYITFWEYDGEYYDTPMWFGELNDYAKENDNFFLQRAVLDENRNLRQCLTKEDIENMMQDEHFSKDLLSEWQSDVRKGLIRCTPELERWFKTDSYDIKDCEEDWCTTSE